MLCVKCKKNMAVVYIKKLEAGKQSTEGYCIPCANELGISPLNDMMKQMGISEEEMESMQDQFGSMMEMLENGEMPPELEGFAGTLGFAPEGMPTGGESDKKEEKNGKKADKNNKNQRKRPRLIDTFGTNMNKKAKDGKVDRIIGRDKELMRVIQILNRRAKNNPCLIGEPGVGKTAIAEALALKIVEGKVPSKLLDKEVYLVDFAAMVAGTQFRGQFEQRVKGIIDEVKAQGNIILVIDEVHNIVGGGGTDGSLSAANILKPSLARGDIQVIGATTLAEYRKYIEKDAALERRFQPVIVEEPSVAETIEIIKGIRDYYEKHHHIIVSDDVIRQAVMLSKRFIQGRFLPDKAIDVIDEAGAKANLDNEILTQLTILYNKEKELKKEMAEFEEAEKDSENYYEKAAELKSRECALSEQIAALEPQLQSTAITAEDVAGVVELWANVPVSKLSLHESEQLMKLESEIKKKIIGQDSAADAVAKAIRRKRAGVEGRLRPASFIFVGPTGVGKTELVKVLAEELFGSKDDLIRLDMTEYSEQHSVSKLIGSPPGYVGYDEAGQLTEKVRRRPYSVVLFDEIEKAHSSIFNILLQILDEG
ncbi:MAG: ATP-dependent Clp protease ATP-binding subunit, partial [Clostridia bacterium]|nr:ATP-dependent Clp protease ATP-binding subunit [Clostridia bacterium]